MKTANTPGPWTLEIDTVFIRQGVKVQPVLYHMDPQGIADARLISSAPALLEAAKERNVEPHVGIIRAHDAFYAESVFAGGDYLLKDKPWIESGVLSTENESSTLFTLCTVRKCRSGTILIPVGHHLFPEEMISTEQLTEAIKLESLIALDAAVKLKQKFG